MKQNEELNSIRGILNGLSISIILWYGIINLILKLTDIFI